MHRDWKYESAHPIALRLDQVMDVTCLDEIELVEFNEVLQRVNLQPREFSQDIGIMSETNLSHYQPAVDIVVRAIDSGRKICVVYDYDCDGITAGVSLVETLKALKANVYHCVPDRIRDGYGMNAALVKNTVAEPCLVVTVDNGITCVAATDELTAEGYEVLITDHHIPEGELPKASYILNPKVFTTEDDDEYMGSGCYVSAKLSMLLLKHYHPGTFYAESSIVYQLWQFLTCLTGLSIVSDIIPINRTMSMQLQLAMTELAIIDHAGIRALCKMANLRPNQPITSEFIGFYLAPKINSAGRIGDAKVAFDLLSRWHVEGEMGVVYQEATALQQLTSTRKILESEVYDEAIKIIELRIEKFGTQPAIVLRNDCWHPGVTGIVASRIVEQYGVPCILLSKCAETMSSPELSGSGRAPEGYDLKMMISSCSQYLTKFGGHKVACGLTLDEKNAEAFCTAFEQAVAAYPRTEVNITYQGEISLSTLANVNFQLFLSNCAPHGNTNAVPIMRLNGLKVLKTNKRVNSLELLVCKNNDDSQPCVVLSKFRPPSGWDALTDKVIDVLCSPTPNYYKGFTEFDYRIVDIHVCD